MLMRDLFARYSVAFALVVYLPVAGGAIYKWVDENGKVHYSDKPHAEATELHIAPGSGESAPTLSDEQRRDKQRRVLEAFEKQRKEKQAAKAKAEQDKAKHAAHCANLREELQKVEQATYLYDVDDDGNTIVYSKQQRIDATAAMRKQLADEC